MVIQREYQPHASPMPPKCLQLSVDVRDIEPDKVDELQRRLDEFGKGEPPDIQARISVKRI